MGGTWAQAMATGLHGPDGFYRRGRGPVRDFRTATTVAPDLMADALVRLLDRLPVAVRGEVVEVGAGTGALLAALAERLPAPVRLVGVEQRARPAGLPERVVWRSELPASVRGLLLAVEWLDTVPVDVVVDGRVLEVAPDGSERAGPRPGEADLAWLARWWPTGVRREVGFRRDHVWADAVSRLVAGVAVTVDYGHRAGDRPAAGSLMGYRAGRAVPPLPDGDTDVTAAVAWDAVLAAVGRRCPGARSVLLPQAAVLRELGLTAALPPRAATDAAALDRVGRARLLLDPAGLGGFGWAFTAVATDLPLGRLGAADFLEWRG